MMTFGKTVVVGLAVGVLASGCHKDAPRLDAAHLPAEVHGLLPGVADEAAVAAALPGAEKTADKRLGGTVKVELNDEAAISFAVKAANSDTATAEATSEAWLVKLGDVPRVAMIRTKVADRCTSAIATLGDHVTEGTCGASNRKFGPEEHEMCATTPDGAHEISIECNSTSGNLEFWVRFNDSHSHSTMINRN